MGVDYNMSFAHSRVGSNTFTMGIVFGQPYTRIALNSMHARVDFIPQSGTLNLASVLPQGPYRPKIASFLAPFSLSCCETNWFKMNRNQHLLNSTPTASSSFICSHSMIKILHTGLGFFQDFFFIQNTIEKKLITVLESKYENTWQRIFCRIQQEISLL